MPLSAQYEWQEKKDIIQIQVPLKGISPANVDIFVTETTLKINFSPYLIDIVLAGSVDSLRHKAKVKAGILKITLFKTSKYPKLWGVLENANDAEKATSREISAIKQKETEERLSELRKERKVADERHSVRKQMALEEAERTRIEEKKETEKRSAEEEMYATFSRMQSSTSTSHKNLSSPLSNVDHVDDWPPQQPSDDKQIYSDFNYNGACGHVEDVTDDIKYIPPPRSAHNDSKQNSHSCTPKVDINFTPRVFPTPMRESTQANEEDWIAKNRKHLKKHGTLGKNIPKGKGVDITEEDPAWLKAKGDDFFRVGDFMSAINAYSAALDCDDGLFSCYSNRSACYLKLNSPQDCKMDCTEAIRILEKSETKHSDETGNTKLYLKILMRRGIASCQLGLFQDALNDYEKCTKIVQEHDFNPQDISVKSLTMDTEKLMKLERSDTLKKSADKKFSQGEFSEALQLYSDAISETPVHVGCLSNRAACKMASRDFRGCIRDCTKALDIFDSDNSELYNGPIQSGGDYSMNMLTAIIPIPGSDKRKSWYLKTLVRRGAASFQAGNITDAISDYSKASAMDPCNNSLKSDLNNLKNRVAKNNK